MNPSEEAKLDAETDRETQRLWSLTKPLIDCWYCSKQRHRGGECECGAPENMPENFL